MKWGGGDNQKRWEGMRVKDGCKYLCFNKTCFLWKRCKYWVNMAITKTRGIQKWIWCRLYQIFQYNLHIYYCSLPQLCNNSLQLQTCQVVCLKVVFKCQLLFVTWYVFFLDVLLRLGLSHLKKLVGNMLAGSAVGCYWRCVPAYAAFPGGLEEPCFCVVLSLPSLPFSHFLDFRLRFPGIWSLELSLPGKPFGNEDLHYQTNLVSLEHFLRETLIAIKSEVLPAAR